MGSVKDLVIIKNPTANEPGIGRFVFSDRYSVFDWGEMPNHIADKGKAICLATAYFFEKLETLGIKTHYRGVVENGVPKRLAELQAPQNVIEIKLLRVLKPPVQNDRYDYSIYQQERANFLIPLEIIYRNSLPAGSSVFRRLQSGSLQLSDLGLEQMPQPGQVLSSPIFDLSTKLETTDRYLTWAEARQIASLSTPELEELQRLTMLINQTITHEAQRIGLFNEDGKVEFGFDEQRNFILVDALGTLDECRFTYEGLPVSKEITRIYYRKTAWYRDVEAAKNLDRLNWKALVKSSPSPLPPKLAEAIAHIYKAYANALCQRQWFEVPSLSEVLKTIPSFIA